MPLTAKGSEILHNMKEEYGEKKGEEVFYASRNKGTISGVDSRLDTILNDVQALHHRLDALGKGEVL